MSQQPKQLDGDENEHEDSKWPYSILNVASVASFCAFKHMAPYCTGKGAVAQLTKSSALDLAKYKIRSARQVHMLHAMKFCWVPCLSSALLVCCLTACEVSTYKHRAARTRLYAVSLLESKLPVM